MKKRLVARRKCRLADAVNRRFSTEIALTNGGSSWTARLTVARPSSENRTSFAPDQSEKVGTHGAAVGLPLSGQDAAWRLGDDDVKDELIDLRSDTLTKPTQAMRHAMAEADVGDDVYGEDPTVKVLETRTAELLGKEAALFVPSGTMANQIGVGVNTQPGDELLCSSTSHVYVWEAGGIARLSGVTARTFAGDRGILSLDELRDAIRPSHDVHYVRTRLISLENTHNRGGGRVHPITGIAEIAGWARENDLAMHLDGARLMNAVVASGHRAADWCTISTRYRSVFPKGWGPRSARPWPVRPPRFAAPGGCENCSAGQCARSGFSLPAPCTPWIITSIG